MGNAPGSCLVEPDRGYQAVTLFKSTRERLRGSVRGLLHLRLGGSEAARPYRKVHASMLTHSDEFCPREFVLGRMLGKVPTNQTVPLAMRVTFDAGNDMQWRVNNDYLRQQMWGDWLCRGCGRVERWCAVPAPCCMLRSPGDQRDCEVSGWEYVEPTFTHPTGVVGSIDGFVRGVARKLIMLEMKILDKDEYLALLAPKQEHRLRTQLYLRLIAESRDKRARSVDLTRASLLYQMRGFGKSAKDSVGTGTIVTPFKEFTIRRDDEAVQYLLNKAAVVEAGHADKMLPGRICEGPACYRAKVCAMAKACFSAAYSQQVLTWQEGRGQWRHKGKRWVRVRWKPPKV